jgi:hypothetical protein
MSTSTHSRFFIITLSASLLVLSAMAVPATASADSSEPPPDNGNCVNCHDNLYYLHDTGKYFCLNESPMACTDCHGGNPQATTQDEAHILREAHPVINEDTSKCQECHPEQCTERMSIFDRVAGFSDTVLIAGAPLPQLPVEQSVPLPAAEETAVDGWMFPAMELIILLIFTALIMALYIYRKAHNENTHNKG